MEPLKDNGHIIYPALALAWFFLLMVFVTSGAIQWVMLGLQVVAAVVLIGAVIHDFRRWSR